MRFPLACFSMAGTFGVSDWLSLFFSSIPSSLCIPLVFLMGLDLLSFSFNYSCLLPGGGISGFGFFPPMFYRLVYASEIYEMEDADELLALGGGSLFSDFPPSISDYVGRLSLWMSMI